MTNANVRDKILQSNNLDDNITIKGLTFTVESTHETPLGDEI
jgi:hypothetical protein